MYITAGENKTTGSNLTREQMIQLLNEDLAQEYQAMIEITAHIDHLNGKSVAALNPGKTSNSPAEVLRAVMENERKMTEHYRERVRQAEAMGESTLSEILREIIMQEH